MDEGKKSGAPDDHEMDEEFPALTKKEAREVRAQARKNIEAARKKAMIKDLTERETRRLEKEEGLVSGTTHMDEIVACTIDCAPYAKNIVVNFEPYWHGHTYYVPRHVAASLQEQCARTWAHQNAIDGKSLTESILQPRNSVIGPSVARNAPTRPDGTKVA